jgi:hypothetical protein
MYITNNISELRDKDSVEVECESCNKIRIIKFVTAKSISRENGKHLCQSCKAKENPRLQNKKEFWDKERRDKHRNIIKQSKKHQESMKDRKHTPRSGFKHSIETRKKMSISRTGKIGENATAWRGGKSSVNVRVKGFLQKKYNWYYRVYQRDNWKCVKCGSKKTLDAHHIKPLSKIIKELLKDKTFENDSEKVMWLLEQKEIIDPNLENGITLCRQCHKLEHRNWGSHYAN